MLTRLDIFKWLLTAWLVLGVSVCVAWAYTPNPQAAQYPQFTTTTPTSQMASSPTYQFRSTSVYVSTMDQNPFFTPLADQAANGGPKGRIRKGANPWDEDPGDDDDPIGVVPDYAPIGSPLVLLALAMLYLAVRIYRRKKA